MDAILKSQAEKLANELATQVTTLEDLNGIMRTMMKTEMLLSRKPSKMLKRHCVRQALTSIRFQMVFLRQLDTTVRIPMPIFWSLRRKCGRSFGKHQSSCRQNHLKEPHQ